MSSMICSGEFHAPEADAPASRLLLLLPASLAALRWPTPLMPNSPSMSKVEEEEVVVVVVVVVVGGGVGLSRLESM